MGTQVHGEWKGIKRASVDASKLRTLHVVVAVIPVQRNLQGVFPLHHILFHAWKLVQSDVFLF